MKSPPTLRAGGTDKGPTTGGGGGVVWCTMPLGLGAVGPDVTRLPAFVASPEQTDEAMS